MLYFVTSVPLQDFYPAMVCRTKSRPTEFSWEVPGKQSKNYTRNESRLQLPVQIPDK